MQVSTGNPRIRVAMIEDDHDLRTMWRTWFATHPGVNVVAEASDCSAVMDLVGQARPDVLLLDVDAHPDLDGMGAARQVRDKAPNTKIISLATDVSSPALHEDGLADAYVSRGALPSELGDAVKDVFEP